MHDIDDDAHGQDTDGLDSAHAGDGVHTAGVSALSRHVPRWRGIRFNPWGVALGLLILAVAVNYGLAAWTLMDVPATRAMPPGMPMATAGEMPLIPDARVIAARHVFDSKVAAVAADAGWNSLERSTETAIGLVARGFGVSAGPGDSLLVQKGAEVYVCPMGARACGHLVAPWRQEPHAP